MNGYLGDRIPSPLFCSILSPVGRSDKLVPRHRGPYQVMHISGAIYTIQDLVDGKVLETHIHNLRPFNYDKERTDPVAVAQQNAQEFVVEEVLAHRGDRAIVNKITNQSQLTIVCRIFLAADCDRTTNVRSN